MSAPLVRDRIDASARTIMHTILHTQESHGRTRLSGGKGGQASGSNRSLSSQLHGMPAYKCMGRRERTRAVIPECRHRYGGA